MVKIGTSDETSAVTLGALQARFRGRSPVEFHREFDSPLMVHEREPDSPRTPDVGFRTLVLSTPVFTVSRTEKTVHLLRKVLDRNPFASMVTIGRAPNNDIVLPYESISKFHAYVRQDPGSRRLVLHDAGSVNGTYLERQRLPAHTGAPLVLPDDAPLDVSFGGDVKFSLYSPFAFWAVVLAPSAVV